MQELVEAMQDSWSKWSTREGIKNLPETNEQPASRRVRFRACQARTIAMRCITVGWSSKKR